MNLGMIGGADGPTAVFVSGSPGLLIAAVIGGAALLALVLWLLLRHKK